MKQKLQTEVIIVGSGNSYQGDSKGEFLVTHYYIHWLHKQPYELQLFGPKTIWQHYTDSGIEEEVNNKLLSFLQARVDSEIKKVAWSERGMQPDDGWSFDIII